MQMTETVQTQFPEQYAWAFTDEQPAALTMTQDELATELSQRTGRVWKRSTVVHAMRRHNLYRRGATSKETAKTEVIADTTPTESDADKIARERSEWKVEQEQVLAVMRAEKRYLSDLAKNEARVRNFLDQLRGEVFALPAPPAWVPPADQPTERTPHALLLQWNDFHAGKHVREDLVGDGFTYEKTELEQSLDRWLEAIEDITEIHRRAYPVNVCYLTILGDMVEGCYAADTEVLTRTGWKNFADVDINVDKFATRNPDTHMFEWQHATRFFGYDYEGEMHAFTSRSVDLLVTPNHRMLIASVNDGRERFIEAEELAEHYARHMAIPTTSVWVGERMEQFSLPPKSDHRLAQPFAISGDDYAALMGMFLSEGSTSVTSTAASGEEKLVIRISQERGSKGYEPFRDLVTRICGGREPFYNGSVWSLHNGALARYLRQFGKASEKFIPEEVKNLSCEQLQIFLEHYRLGDGHTRPDGLTVITTCSKRMADDLQEVIQKVGGSTAITSHEHRYDSSVNGRSIERRHPTYTLNLRRSKQHRVTPSRVPYTGKVYCVSVPNTTLYVRRNGRPVWCGNSDMRSSQKLRIDHAIGTIGRQTVYVGNKIAEVVQWLSGRFEKVVVLAVSGNHGRVGKYGENEVVDNFDWLAYHIAELLCKDLPNVIFQISDPPTMLVKIGEKTLLLQHGNAIRSWGESPAGAIKRGVRKDAFVAQQFFDYALGAHFHQSISFQAGGKTRVFFSGNWDGGDSYCVHDLKEACEPSQNAFIFHPTRGIVCHYEIALRDKDRSPMQPIDVDALGMKVLTGVSA